MPRRRDLRGVAFGLLGAFVSRNNDVGGYWALGKLYEHAQVSNASEVQVDLVRSIITPSSPQFAKMIGHFRQMLVKQVAARRLFDQWLRAAEVRVKFSGDKCVDRPGDAFECSVILTDDLGHLHQAQASGACWVHDPAKERKSART